MNISMLFQFNKAKIYFIVTSLILNVLALYPMINSGYMSDDSINSLIVGVLHENNQRVLGFSYSIIKSWIDNGRFFPLAFYAYSLFKIISSLLLYKLSILAMVLINIILFSYFVKLITKSVTLSMFSLLLPTIFFQFRSTHDPILSFHWLLQIIFMLTLSSLIFLYFYLEKKNKKFLVLSIILYCISLLTYEITITFFIFHLLIIFNFTKSRRVLDYIRISLPYIILVCTIVSIPVILRFTNEIPLSGNGSGGSYVPNLNLKIYITTLIKQTISAFPLSYFLFDPHEIFDTLSNNLNNFFSFNIILIVICFIFLFIEIFKSFKQVKVLVNLKLLFYLGIAFLILPSVLISLSPTYQSEIMFGYGYLPIYISLFGLIMLFLWFVGLIINNKYAHKFKYFLVSTLALVIIGIGIINYCNNAFVVERENQRWLFPRTLIEDAMNRGISNKVPNKSILITEKSNSWDVLPFYNMHSNGRFLFVGIKGSNIPKQWESNNNEINNSFNFNEGNHPYYLDYKSYSADSGYALLSKINSLTISKDKISGLMSDKVYLYIRHPKYYKQGMSVTGLWSDKNNINKSSEFSLNDDKLTFEASGVDWHLYSIISKDMFIDVKSLNINTFSKLNTFSTILKDSNEYIFDKSSNTVLHTGFKRATFENGFQCNAVFFSDKFTIEAIVIPENKQVDFANILGNHPGYNNHEGFVIQQQIQTQNIYNFDYGSGSDWISGVTFPLTANITNYITILYDGTQISAYVNGELKSRKNADIKMMNSEMPLYIGNWSGVTRPFSGEIEEVRISNDIINESEIISNWNKIKTK